MKITHTPLSGLILLQPKVYADDRGYFYESYQQARYQDADIPLFVQDNVSRSKKNVLRGLHFQNPHAQGKLVTVLRGHIWDVAIDIRQYSPTFGQWFSQDLTDENHCQLYIPPGFAHGFCVLSEYADVYYQCTDIYSPNHEHGIAWNDTHLNIPWPITHPLLSAKDQNYPSLVQYDKKTLL